MKVFVMSADRRSGISKKTNQPYDSVVVQGVYVIGTKFAVKELWINPEHLNGVLPEYGNILDVQVDFAGFVQPVVILDNETFALSVRNK